MKKSTKIITTAVALALVVAAMVVGIYAATQATSTITAQVSWTATAGITFELKGSVAGGATTPTAVSHTVTTATNNDTAGTLSGTLSTNFKDADKDTATDNGVNDPGAITYTYTLKNTGAQAIKVRLSKAPEEGAEANVDGTHTPAVAYNVSGVTGATYEKLVASPATVEIAKDATLTITITLSLAAGGTNNGINADLSVSNFDAGVTFVMTK